MIDSPGSDSTSSAAHPRQVAEIDSESETPDSLSPLKPKVRYANYDSPEALALPDLPPQPSAPVQPARARKPQPASVPSSASTALGRSTSKPSTFDRAVSVAKTVLPLVGKLMPLLEGNFVSAASNLLSNGPVHEVNLRPLEDSIARLQADHRALTFHTSEQKHALRRLEDEFASLQDAVQKNAADQAELIEGVVKLAKRTSSFMRLVIILLVASLLFTALLCVRIAYIIRF